MEKETQNRIPDAFLDWLLDELITGGHLQTDWKPPKTAENEHKAVKSGNGAESKLKTHSGRVRASKRQN